MRIIGNKSKRIMGTISIISQALMPSRLVAHRGQISDREQG